MNTKDVWEFYVGKNKKAVKVRVHLDITDELTQEFIVKELVRYICAFENIKRTGTNK